MRNVANRVGIMYLGKLVEVAPASDFFHNPLHPYTKMLISSVPVISKEEEELKPKRIISRGEIPSPVNIPPGCPFHPRCSEPMKVCYEKEPKMLSISSEHFVKCHIFGVE